MRIGFLTDSNLERLDWAQANGFGSIAWNRVETSAVGPQEKNWQPAADAFAGASRERNLRISAIEALYKNPLDPTQTEFARSVFFARHRSGGAPGHQNRRWVSRSGD